MNRTRRKPTVAFRKRPYGKHRARCSSSEPYLKSTVPFLRGMNKSPKSKKAKRKRKGTPSPTGPRIIPGPTALQSPVQCLPTTPANDREHQIILRAARMKNPGAILRAVRIKMSQSNILNRTKSTFSHKVWTGIISMVGSLFLQTAK